MKRSIWSERNLVVILFIMVIVIFSFAQADSNKIEKIFLDSKTFPTSSFDEINGAKTTTVAHSSPAEPLH